MQKGVEHLVFCLNRFRREKLGEDHQRQKTEEEGVQKFWRSVAENEESQE